MLSKIVSLVAVVLVTYGFLSRRKKKLHIRLMIAAFVIDISLLLYIELTRQAIKTAVSPPHPYVSFHVFVSVIVVILYFVQIFLGRRLARFNEAHIRRYHHHFGIAFLVFRYLNFGTSLFIDKFIN